MKKKDDSTETKQIKLIHKMETKEIRHLKTEVRSKINVKDKNEN